MQVQDLHATARELPAQLNLERMSHVVSTRTFLQGDVNVLERREGMCLITIRFEDTAIDRCEFRRRRF